MEKNVWPYLRDLHLNTVLLPVAWEMCGAGVRDAMIFWVEATLEAGAKGKWETGASLVWAVEKRGELLYSSLDEGEL